MHLTNDGCKWGDRWNMSGAGPSKTQIQISLISSVSSAHKSKTECAGTQRQSISLTKIAGLTRKEIPAYIIYKR